MTYTIRDATPDDVGSMSSFSILTILETLEDARRDPSVVPGFTHDEMATMYRKGLENPAHRYRVLAQPDGRLVGHGIYLLREDETGATYGYLYTRYVLPAHRRRGLGGQLLDEALNWFRNQEAGWVEAHTHPTNAPLQGLLQSRGFEAGPVIQGHWESVLLRKMLD